jgi:hypothetical protein
MDYSNVHSVNTFGEFCAIIQTLWEIYHYEILYVSLGGKFNESQLSFSFPQEIKQTKYTTNASYQLIPQFLRDRDIPQKTLIIALDDFSNAELLLKNQQIVGNTIGRQDAHMSVVLFNQVGSQVFITRFIKYIADQMAYWKMDPKKCMICNYIRFIRPNAHETIFESQLPTLIQEILNQTEYEQYSACFYNWFGYSIYTYNIIYNHKKYMFSLMHNELFIILNKSLQNTHLSCMNLDLVKECIDNENEHYFRPFVYFLKHSIDITTFCTSPDDIGLPMITYME